MKKVCLIVPYFGHLPNYFQLFLKSCAANTDFNWLIFTDDNTPYNYPNNVTRVLTSFTEIKKLFASKFDFNIALDSPYKFCDFKPTYGYVFEDYLKNYLFWGHCDIDTIMGKFSDFLTDDFLSQYDKIFALGHMTLYRNTPENNRVFMRPYKGKLLYKEYLSNPKICVFDEDCKNEYNIHNIFKAEGKSVYEGDYSLNFDIAKFKFRRVQYVGIQSCPLTHGHIVERNKKALYLWNNGEVCRYYISKDNIVKETFLYVHFQMRKMYLMPKVDESDNIRFSPNVFSNFVDKVDDQYLHHFHPLVYYPKFFYVRCNYCWVNFRRFVGRIVRTIFK